MLDKNTRMKNIKRKNWPNESILKFYKKASNMPHVVWAEESKHGLGFEIGPT